MRARSRRSTHHCVPYTHFTPIDTVPFASSQSACRTRARRACRQACAGTYRSCIAHCRVARIHPSDTHTLLFFTCRRHRDRVVRRGLAMMCAFSNRTLQCIAYVACLLTRLSVYCAGSRATSTRAHAHSRMRQRDHPPLPALAKTDRLCFLSCPVPTPAASTLPARAAH